MLRPKMVMEALSSERRILNKCTNTMFDLYISKKIQSWSFCRWTHKVVAVAEVDPREVMSQVRKTCRLVRVDWIENPRLEKIKDDPSRKWWVDPVEDLRKKWVEDIRNSKFVDPAEDPRKKWPRRMVMEMLSCDTDEWAEALTMIKRRFDDKIFLTILDTDLKKLVLVGDMDPSEVVCCVRDYCRLLIVEWIPDEREYLIRSDGLKEMLIPNLDEVDEKEAKRKILDEALNPLLISESYLISPEEKKDPIY